MRKALNENPVVQVAVVGVLIVVVGFVFMMNMGGGGGGGDEGAAPTAASTTPTTTTGGSTTAESATSTAGAMVTPIADRPLGPEPPAPVRRAYDRGDTVVLLIVRDGGIEDDRVKRSVEALGREPGVSVFIVPAAQIGNYSHLTQGMQVSRVPALVIVSPKQIGGDAPVAQLHYGFRSKESIQQAVRDATYEGQPASYGPD